MFVEYSTSVELGVAELEKRFNEISSGLDHGVDLVHLDGTDLVSKVGPAPAVARDVTLDIGPAEIHKTGVVILIHWAARTAEGLFPDLTADLVISPEGRSRSRLMLRGTYQPPLGPIGRFADRAVMGRVAEATVADWMDRLAAALSSNLSRS